MTNIQVNKDDTLLISDYNARSSNTSILVEQKIYSYFLKYEDINNSILVFNTQIHKPPAWWALWTARVYINSVDSLTGAALLCTTAGNSPSAQISFLQRHIVINNWVLTVQPATGWVGTWISDYALIANTLTSTTLNPLLDKYIILSLQVASSFSVRYQFTSLRKI